MTDIAWVAQIDTCWKKYFLSEMVHELFRDLGVIFRKNTKKEIC